MRAILTLGQRAYGFYQSDDARETWIGAALAMVAVGLAWWRVSGRWRR